MSFSERFFFSFFSLSKCGGNFKEGKKSWASHFLHPMSFFCLVSISLSLLSFVLFFQEQVHHFFSLPPLLIFSIAVASGESVCSKFPILDYNWFTSCFFHLQSSIIHFLLFCHLSASDPFLFLSFLNIRKEKERRKRCFGYPDPLSVYL